MLNRLYESVNFELTIEGDEISGAMMGMFDVEGSRVQPQ